MAERHVSVPKPFASGDVNEWFKRYEICCKANGWNDATKALKFPTLLEGEALAVWLELSEEQQQSYATAKKELSIALMPMEFDSLSYPAHLQAKLAELRDFVEANLTEAAHHQKCAYDQHTSVRSFSAGEHVWLSAPTAGKLEPRWEGGWVIKSVKGPTNMEITNGKTTKVVHTNRLQHRNVPSPSDPNMDVTNEQWNAPTVDHVYVPPPLPTVPRRYPLRQRHAPDRWGF